VRGSWRLAITETSGWRSLRWWIDGRDENATSSWSRWIKATTTSIVLIVVVSVAVEVLDDHAPVLSLSVLYLLAVVPVAMIWGTLFATVVSVLSVLTFGYLFIPPRRNLDIGEAGTWYALLVFVVTAVVVSELATRSQRASRASARLAEEQGALRRVATLVAQQTSREQLDALISEEVGRLLSADLATMRHYDDGGSVRVMGQWARSARLLPTGYPPAVDRVTELIAQTGEPAQAETVTPSGDGRLAVGAPIIVEGQVWGAMIVASGARALPGNTGVRLADFTALVATAIANSKNRDELAASRERVVIAADQTRRRIERDLHDGAQQQLVALAIDLQTIREGVPDQLPRLRADLSQISQGLVSTLDELREIARGIHPAILAQGGLGPALKTLARRCPVPVELHLELESRFSEPVEIATYYVVAEALTNAAKHAEASLVRVTGRVREGVLEVGVQDDGRGGASTARGSGLVGIIDRVEALGGTLLLSSPPGAGTSVELLLPVGERA
jgi:signal transduction histidine kinase